MKPPPRTRTRPPRGLQAHAAPQRTGKLACRWQRGEQRRLLKALRTLSSAGGQGDIDCAVLREHVPTRSVSEIQSVVESLKNKVISCASSKLQRRRWEERKARRPIEEWTHMASAVAGAAEEAISSAFSQMLMVSSTEPRTLRNCDPPHVHRLSTDDRPTALTAPSRPMSCLPVQGERPDSNAARPLLLLKTPALTMGPARRLSAPSQVLRVPNSRICPPPTAATTPAATPAPQPAAASCQPGVSPATGRVTPRCSSAAAVTPASVGSSGTQTTQQPLQHPTTVSNTSMSMSSSSHTVLSSSATSLTPVLSPAPPSVTLSRSATSSCSSTHPTPPISTPATAFHTRFGQNSKYATKDSPTMSGVKYEVDFEKIYRFLSVIQKPSEDCHLTPMESAVVLDLLMSLPEELPLLDCNKLHRHVIQVYQCLSAPAPKKAGEGFTDVKDGLSAQTETASAAPSQQSAAPSQQSAAPSQQSAAPSQQSAAPSQQSAAPSQQSAAPSQQSAAPSQQSAAPSQQSAAPSQQSAAPSQQSAAGTAHSTDRSGSGGQKLQLHEAESRSGSHDTSNQSEEAKVMELCPPLNPFMVPVSLLLRR